MIMESRCPVCGTSGRIWNREPEVFRCPNCSSVFSKFGIVLESEREMHEFWS